MVETDYFSNAPFINLPHHFVEIEAGTNFYLILNFSGSEVVTKEYLEYLPLEVLEAGIKSVSTLKYKLVTDKALQRKITLFCFELFKAVYSSGKQESP